MDKSIERMSLRDLLRRRGEVESALAHREPLLFKEYQLLSSAIEQFDRSPEKPYTGVKWPRAAILLCLERNGKWMTRRQIRRDLEMGGFVFDPETFDNLLAAALRFHASRGVIARRDEDGTLITSDSHKLGTRYRNERFGLTEWLKTGNLESLKES